MLGTTGAPAALVVSACLNIGCRAATGDVPEMIGKPTSCWEGDEC